MESIEFDEPIRKGVSVAVPITVSGTCFEAHFVVDGDNIRGPYLHSKGANPREPFATNAAKEFLAKNRAAILRAALPLEDLEKILAEAAAGPFNCDDREVRVELEERHLTKSGKKSILVNWSHSLTVSEEVRAKAKAAVIDALPEGYRDYHVTLI